MNNLCRWRGWGLTARRSSRSTTTWWPTTLAWPSPTTATTPGSCTSRTCSATTAATTCARSTRSPWSARSGCWRWWRPPTSSTTRPATTPSPWRAPASPSTARPAATPSPRWPGSGKTSSPSSSETPGARAEPCEVRTVHSKGRKGVNNTAIFYNTWREFSNWIFGHFLHWRTVLKVFSIHPSSYQCFKKSRIPQSFVDNFSTKLSDDSLVVGGNNELDTAARGVFRLSGGRRGADQPATWLVTESRRHHTSFIIIILVRERHSSEWDKLPKLCAIVNQ